MDHGSEAFLQNSFFQIMFVQGLFCGPVQLLNVVLMYLFFFSFVFEIWIKYKIRQDQL